jgi:outer membrane lipoprotein SlyB
MLVAGGAGLVALGALAATLALRQPGAAPTPSASASTLATQPASPATALSQRAPTAAATTARDRPGALPGAQPARPGTAQAPSGRGVALDTQPAVAQASVCAHCGTVEAVKSVRQKGEASGVGAVAGGVLGGVVGNQMGKGDGRKAMTVIGAVGGGLAGHEIEKRQRATTVYQVTVRMDDGNTRTLTRPESWAVGRRVTLEGGQLRAMRDAPSGTDRAPRALQTAAPA